VRINRERHDTPSDLVKTGDTLTITLPGSVRVLRIVACGSRRGPAPEARALYEDLAPPTPVLPPAPRAEGAGRPTKRDRRAIMSLKRGGDDFPDDEG
jgi:ribosome-associated heat shock protein Hsp15